jgi:trehalose 6-phosphate synthase
VAPSDDLTDGRPLVLVANRLPVRLGDDGAWEISAGGLVTAMRPVVSRVGGAWIGWDGGDEGVPERVEGLDCSLHPVALSAVEVEDYYHGFSNRTLWPLFHDLVAPPVIDHDWWDTYRRVNERFATDVVEAVPSPDALVWVQDYHLLLLPALLRAALPDQPIGFFLHTPFPAPELVQRLPWRDELLDGILGADVVGFHTPLYRDNFLRAVRMFRGDDAVDGTHVLHEGRRVHCVAQGISIDADEFATLATSPDTEHVLNELRRQFGGRKVFLGVDRLDTTKGIRHRLTAIERLLENHAELREQFAFVQIAVPSREDVAEVIELRGEIEQMVGRINGQFTEPGHDVPVHYLYRGVPRESLAAYYRLADVLAVTPLKDGMNLVAKEYVVVQHAAREDGVLLLSEFTGSALQLDDAVLCNPFDVQGLADTMAACLELDPDDRRARLASMARDVHEHDVFAWVAGQLREVVAAIADRS